MSRFVKSFGDYNVVDESKGSSKRVVVRGRRGVIGFKIDRTSFNSTFPEAFGGSNPEDLDYKRACLMAIIVAKQHLIQ